MARFSFPVFAGLMAILVGAPMRASPQPGPYAPQPVVAMGQAVIRVGPGSTFVDVPVVTTNGMLGNTCYVDVITRNGEHPKIALQGAHFARTETYVRLRPGDEPRAVVRVPILSNPGDGASFYVFMPSEAHGCRKGELTQTQILFDDAAPRTVAARAPARRAPEVCAPPTNAPAFRDDFSAAAITDTGADRSYMNQFTNGRQPPNADESGLYVGRNVAISNGELVIAATPAGAPNPPYKDRTYPYWAGVVTTFTKFNQKGGFWQLRAALPPSHQTWPAFWLLPAGDYWPPEIDWMERIDGVWQASQHLGPRGSRKAVFNVKADLAKVLPGFSETAFNTYALKWNEDYTTWCVNGQEIVQQKTYFKEPAYLLLQIATGGANGPATFTDRQVMRIDDLAIWAARPGEWSN